MPALVCLLETLKSEDSSDSGSGIQLPTSNSTDSTYPINVRSNAIGIIVNISGSV